MVRFLAGRTYANIQMRGGKQFVARFQYVHTMRAHLGAFAAEFAIAVPANDILGYLVTIA